MKIEKREYEILALDGEGHTLIQNTADTLRQATQTARYLLTDPEIIPHKIEIRNHQGECVRDFFSLG